MWESEFEVIFLSDSRWSHLLGIENRGLLQERLNGEKLSGRDNLHVQLDYFRRYQPGENSLFSIGLRYRFREMFDADQRDEIRIIEQFDYNATTSNLDFSHRARFEQRFREETIYRIRYSLGISRQLNDVFAIEVAGEALYGVSPQVRPEAEQRFSLQLENTTFRTLELQIGFEYRMANYLDRLSNEYLFFSEVTLKL